MARPYLATALFSMIPVLDERVPDMSVDRSWHCRANPRLVSSLPPEQLAAMWIHHVTHLLRGHAERADVAGIDSGDVLNLAQDCEINDDLEGEGIALPEDAMRPSKLGLEPGGFFEQYARVLGGIDLVQELPQLGDCGSGAHGSPREWELEPQGSAPNPSGTEAVPVGVSSVEADLIRRETAQQIVQLGTESGHLPASWRRWATETGEGGTDWRSVLRSTVRGSVGAVAGRADYTYGRPSRRAAAVPGVVLPSMVGRPAAVGIVVDTSGSMDEGQLGAALDEIDAVLRSGGVREAEVTVFATDSAVHTVNRARAGHEVELVGGGGTDMGKGIEQAVSAPHRCEMIIVLTDGETPWPERAPPVPVVVGLITKAGRPAVVAAPSPPPWAATVMIR